jgi:8-oxo-dGTP diphosphatase
MRARRSARRRRLFVVAALIERRGRVLLSQRRADQMFPLAWEFPGGKVEPGEAPAEALAREIREELGCGLRVGEVVHLVFHPYRDFDLVMPVYRADLIGRAPRAVTVAAIAWVPRRRLLALAMPPADVPFARQLARTRARPRARDRGGPSSRRSSRPARRSRPHEAGDRPRPTPSRR